MLKIDSILAAVQSCGIKLNTAAYNLAIGSYMSVGEHEKALCIYRSMKVKKIKPDSVTSNILISGLCKIGKYRESLKHLEKMMKLKIPLTREVYSSVICAYSRQASGKKVRIICIDSIFNVCLILLNSEFQGLINEAERMFNVMKTEGFCPDVVTYTTMIHAYSEAGSVY